MGENTHCADWSTTRSIADRRELHFGVNNTHRFSCCQMSISEDGV